MFSDLLHRLRAALRRQRVEEELEDELQFHLQQQIEKHQKAGLSDEEAARRARMELGGVDQVKEEYRDSFGTSLLDTILQDVRYAGRMMRRSPGFAAVAVTSLAIGIGANTAIFSLMHRLLFEALPVREPDRLVELLTDPGSGRGDLIPSSPFNFFSYQALEHFRTNTQLCSSIIASSNTIFHVRVESGSWERLNGQYVTGDYFAALGVGVVRGRPLTTEDDRMGSGNPVAVISYSMWQSRFGAGPETIGKILTVENRPFTIVGVAARNFSGLEVGREPEFWIPLATEPQLRTPSNTSSPANKWLQLVGRLKPGVSFEEARSELRVLFDQAVIEKEKAFSGGAERVKSWSFSLEPAGAGLSAVRRQFSAPLAAVMAVVVAVLLIACSNVANLLFARATRREKEIALRLSLGAGRGRVIRQLLTESALLGASGAAIGVLIAYLGSGYLTGFLATGRTPLNVAVPPNVPTLMFTSIVAACTVLLFGLLPALRTSRMDFTSRLKGSGAGRNVQHRRLRVGLTVAQIGLLVVLILGAGLFLRSLRNLKSVELGFERDNVLLVTVDPFGSGHTPERLSTLYAQLLDRLVNLPGVTAAGLSSVTPVSGGGVTLSYAIEDGQQEPRVARNTYTNRVSPGFFASLAIPLVAGRDFDARDNSTGRPVVIINQTFAERYFGNVSPIGKTITQGGNPLEIIGVVRDAKYLEIREGMQPTVYSSAFQGRNAPSQFLIRTEQGPLSLVAAVRNEMKSLIGNVSIRDRTLASHVDASIVQERLLGALAGFFGGLALFLAVVGLYGVISSGVMERTREIGIRIALGHAPRGMVLMVLREVLVLAGGGVALGLPVAFWITRSIRGLLYGLTPDDPHTMVVSVLFILFAAVAAAFLPALRASRVDPMIALRHE